MDGYQPWLGKESMESITKEFYLVTENKCDVHRKISETG